jgi:hypothetical protein
MTELFVLWTSAIVAESKIIGLSSLEVLLFACSSGFSEYLAGIGMLAMKPAMQENATMFTSLANILLKRLNFAFSNEHPPQN